MRKIKAILFLCLAACLTLGAAAASVERQIGKIYSTDIRASFDGYEIPAYNVDGHLCVMAEELTGYGFSVIWDDETRTLSLSQTGRVTAPLPVKKEELPSGTVVGSVLSTDIVTSLEGVPVTSYNIGGRTVIPFSSLELYGTRVYDNATRTSTITLFPTPPVTLTDLAKKVIHAGGTVGGYAGSNSLEALEVSYAAGFRCFEMDFLLSSDGHPVALHDWARTYAAELTGQPITLAEFEALRIYGRFTPMTLTSLCEFLASHPDVYIVTDVKDDNIGVLTQIAAAYPEILPRLLPQIYGFDEYAPVRALGYSNIILTCYRLPTYNEKADAKALADFARAHRLLAVTVDATLANADYVCTFNTAGVPLYVHTVNGEEEQQRFFALGVFGVYTDFAE